MKRLAFLLACSAFLFCCALPGNHHSDPPDPPPDVYLDGYGRLIVHGRMIFPIGLHYSKVDYLDQIAAAGFNFVWADANELSPVVDFHVPPRHFPYTWETFLEQVQAHGLYGFFSLGYDEVQALYDGTITWDDLAVTLDAIKDNPALLGYQILDEPESKPPWGNPCFMPPFISRIGAGYRQRYPGKPTKIANTNMGVYTYYAHTADIMDLNIYPVFDEEHSSLGSPPDVAVNMDAAVDARVGAGPVWACLQAYGNDIPERADTWPSRAQLRYMTYLALAHGAQGITYFRFYDSPGPGTIQTRELHDAVFELAGELSDLSPVLLSTAAIFAARVHDNPDIECFIKIYDGTAYLFAVNNTDQAQTCNFNFPGLTEPVPVLFEEGRSVAPGADGFGDSFLEYEVHIYAVPLFFTLAHPAQGSPACVNRELTLTAAATYPGLTKVEFYVDDELLAEDTTPADGFRASWTPPECHFYRLKAVGIFTDLSTIESPEISVLTYYGEGRYVWHSYNVNMEGKYITDMYGNRAYLEFYQSSDTDGVQPGEPMNSLHDNIHPHEYTDTVIPYWTTDPGSEEPYVGLYTTPRTAVPEAQKPVLLPFGVEDIAIYPPWQKLTVIAFHVPADGDYMVTDLGIKKTTEQGFSVSLKLFDPGAALLTTLTAWPCAMGGPHVWYCDDTHYDLPGLHAGELIYFALDCDADTGNDYAVITFTVIKTD
jgi:hypothetical protein